MVRGLSTGLVLLGLLFLASQSGAGTSPRFFPARPTTAPPAGSDWFAIWDGSKFGPTKADTLSAANARWRAVRETSPRAELYRYSASFQKWLKVAG